MAHGRSDPAGASLGRDRRSARLPADLVDEQIDAVTRVFMSSSVACARCHDHKFDPFSMSDYYALAGVFRSTKTFFGTAVSPANRVGGDPLVLPSLDDTPVLHRGISAKRVQDLIDERDALERERTERKRRLPTPVGILVSELEPRP